MAFTDFPNGLSGAADYLSAQNSLNAQLTGSVADIGRLVISAELDFNLKEIICSLLAGRGLKLPNIQICISLNLKELLGGLVGQVQQALYDALASLDAAFDRFLDHLKLDEVLGRINNVLAEVTNIANMINFCSAPLDPIQIPNVLENAMESFLGAGKSIIDSIGQILPDQIGGCLIDGQFNGSVFSGGILKKIADNIDDLDSIADTLISDIGSVVGQIDDLIDRESRVTGTYDNGGSDLSESPRSTWDGVGALYNAQDEGIQGAVRNGSGIWAAYQQLGSYQVVDSDGRVYNNIFELFLEDDLMRILRRTPNPTPEIAEQQPVYNYCGEIIGFTKVVSQENPDTSVGKVPDVIQDPGFNAGGLPTNPINEAIAEGAAAGGGTVIQEINNTYNIDGGVIIVNDEAGLLSSNSAQGQIVYRTDINTAYVDNGGDTGTLADYEVISGGGSTLNDFLSAINSTNTGKGLVTRNDNTVIYRSIAGTANQITVSNGNAIAANPTIALASNPIIPGTDAMIIPQGSEAQKITNVTGAIRYNTTTARFEGYHGGSWLSFATGSGSVTDGANVGGGSLEIYKQNNIGTLEFRTINVSGAITAGVAGDVIIISENLVGSSLGTGADVFKARSGNNLQFRSIRAGAGVSVTENADDITIATDGVLTATLTTTNDTPTVALTNTSLPAGDAWYFEVQATAKRTDSGSHVASIKLEGILDNTGGTYDIAVDSANKTIYSGVGTTTGLDVDVDDNSGAGFRVQVTGRAAETFKWAIRVKYHQV